MIYFIVSVALIEQENETDDEGISRSTIAVLILTGIVALMVLTFMGCVVTFYWSSKYAKWLENHFGITTC